MGYVNLSKMPDPPKIRVSSIQNLKGGLNIHDTPWQIRANQSPAMQNMYWSDGALRSRPGITAYNNGSIVAVDDASVHEFSDLRAHRYPFHGWYVICNPHRGVFTLLQANNPDYWLDVNGEDGQAAFSVAHTDGMFFEYSGDLYYKSVGGYYRLFVSEEYDYNAGLYLLRAEEVVGFVPTTYMNAVPDNLVNDVHQFGGGDFYQPYNRMSLKRKILYNCSADTKYVVVPEAVDQADGSLIAEYLDAQGAWNGINIPAKVYQADRTVLDFSDGSLGTALAAAGTDGVTNNIRMTYQVPATGENLVQYNSVMDCSIVDVYGGNSGLFVVMAGYQKQPNAYFWSGNSDTTLDPGYFPVEHYNLSGDVSDPIVGFGKQQNMLIVFQERRIGRCSYDTATIDGRTFVTLNYTTINPKVGCDMPGTIQLVENNLVFANRTDGVMFLKDSSSAYENNVVNISQNIERPRTERGLFYDLNGIQPNRVLSFDDSKRYWLMVGDHVWVWDYSLGGEVNNPETLSWFYFDAFPEAACCFALDDAFPSFYGRDGYLRRFKETLTDTFREDGTWERRGQDFDKVLTLPIQDFGTYEVLKNVEKCVFVLRGSGNNFVDVEYETDYGTRLDQTKIYIPGWSLVPRDLTFRNLRIAPFATTAVRKPRCIHVRHFLARMKNANRGDSVAFVSAQIFYTLQGADR